MNKVNNSVAILLNGPASCGKGIVVDYLRKQGIDLKVKSCKDHLHKLTMEFFCVPEEAYWSIYNDRKLKEKPNTYFRIKLGLMERIKLRGLVGNTPIFRDVVYLSIRQAMIYVSEIVCKPRFGYDYFGKARALSVQDNEVILDDSCSAFLNDSGVISAEEIYPLMDSIGENNILLIRIHRSTCNFNNDSRRYVPDGVVNNTIDVYNDGDEKKYIQFMKNTIYDFIDLR
jgi:hypothetical protein